MEDLAQHHRYSGLDLAANIAYLKAAKLRRVAKAILARFPHARIHTSFPPPSFLIPDPRSCSSPPAEFVPSSSLALR